MSGTIDSINTNVGAMIALDALNSTNTQLNSVQKQISTGYRVADAVDDGAAYAVAQSVRSSVGALTTANQQLGSTQGLLSTTSAALNDTSNLMASMRDVLVALSNGATQGNERTQYNSLLANVKSFVEDAQGNRIWNFLDSLTESASTKCHLGVAKMRSWWPVEPPRSPRRQGPGGPTRYQPLPIPAFLGALASWRLTPGPRRKPQDDANSKCDCPGIKCV